MVKYIKQRKSKSKRGLLEFCAWLKTASVFRDLPSQETISWQSSVNSKPVNAPHPNLLFDGHLCGAAGAYKTLKKVQMPHPWDSNILVSANIP